MTYYVSWAGGKKIPSLLQFVQQLKVEINLHFNQSTVVYKIVGYPNEHIMIQSYSCQIILLTEIILKQDDL